FPVVAALAQIVEMSHRNPCHPLVSRIAVFKRPSFRLTAIRKPLEPRGYGLPLIHPTLPSTS
ncbi:MAG: hypothetical protein ACRD4O_10465, partial [Bryobacteraceae bacterium]